MVEILREDAAQKSPSSSEMSPAIQERTGKTEGEPTGKGGLRPTWCGQDFHSLDRDWRPGNTPPGWSQPPQQGVHTSLSRGKPFGFWSMPLLLSQVALLI